MLSEQTCDIGRKDGEVLDLEQLNVIEHGFIVQILDGGADILQSAQLVIQGVDKQGFYPIDKLSETVQDAIGCGDVIDARHQARVHEPPTRESRLQFQSVNHKTDAARRFYDIPQLHCYCLFLIRS